MMDRQEIKVSNSRVREFNGICGQVSNLEVIKTDWSKFNPECGGGET